jgi:serine/threonine protein kinase
MAVGLNDVIKQLTESSIIAHGKLEKFIPPQATPKDAETLAKELVKSGDLTEFQAQHILQGKTKALILGNYTLLDRIGAGGMGQVFKAVHRRMERVVAIKMLPPATTKDPLALARFQREVKAAAKLSHSNIVAAYDADEANGAHFLVMEFVDGKDLSALVKKNGPFPVSKAVNYILQAARGLEFAHGEGIIHRDIKPANLLLDNKGRVKILDMGLARIDTPNAAQAELTGTGAVMGTVDYMSPEQAFNTKHADARSDIYSLGCSLYYLIAGKATYDGESVIEKILAHRERPIPSVSDSHPEAPVRLQTVFEKMVAKRVEDRYQTMSEVIADLEPLAGGALSSASIPPAAGGMVDASAVTFLKNVEATQHKAATTNRAASKASGAPKPAPAAVAAKQPPWKNTKVLVAAGAAGFLLVLFGVWVIVRDKGGAEVARTKVPEGGTVKVSGNTPSAPGPSGGSKSNSTKTTSPSKEPDEFFRSNLATPGTAASRSADGWISLFNGRDLTGWKTHPRFPGQWRVENGVLLGPGGKTSFLFTEHGNFGDVHLRVEARVGSGTSGGIYGRAIYPPDQDSTKYVPGYLVKINADSTVDPVRTGRMYVMEADKYTSVVTTPPRAKANEWFTMDVTIRRNRVLTEVNSQKATDYTDERRLFTLGHIALQVHSGKSPVEFRKIEIKPLGGAPADAKLFAGNHYKVFTDVISWREARDRCAQLGGRLAVIKTAELDKFLTDQAVAPGVDSIWIGATDEQTEGQWAWLDGTKLTYTNWDTGQPNNGAGSGEHYLLKLFTFQGKSHEGRWCDQPLQSKLHNPGFACEWVASASSATSTRAAKPWDTPQFQKWIADTQKLPAEQQIEAVSKKLMELNPGFDGKLAGDDGKAAPKVEQGVVTKLSFVAEQVIDISAVRALSGLRALSVYGVKDRVKFSQLAPIEGLPLTYLHCSSTDVSDLSPLRGMPLTNLLCGNTNVSDLSALYGCQTLSYIYLKSTKVTPAGVAALQKALPNCKIEWDDPASKPPAGTPNK